MKTQVQVTLVVASLALSPLVSGIEATLLDTPEVVVRDLDLGGDGAVRKGAALMLGELSSPRRGQSVDIVVLPDQRLDDSAKEALRSDLAVMMHILKKAVSRAQGVKATNRPMGIRTWWTGASGGGMASALYLPGHGPVFRLSTNIVLASSGDAEKVEKKKEPSEWDRAKAELGGVYQPLVTRASVPGHTAAFDEAKVSRLKAELLKARAKEMESFISFNILNVGAQMIREEASRSR